MMTVLLSAVAFIVLLTLLIIIHEIGHYALAKFFHVSVEEFGFGLPPKAKTLFRRKGTAFTLNWIPFGGFVRLKGENALDEKERFAPGSFGNASAPKKLTILLGGVAMNFALALVIFTIGFAWMGWVPSWYLTLNELQAAADRGEISVEIGTVISGVAPDGPAAEAGIPAHVLLKTVDGEPVTTPEDLIAYQEAKRTVTYGYVLPESEDIHEATVRLEEGKAGIEIQAVATHLSAPTRSIGTACVMAIKESWFITKHTVLGIGDLLHTFVTRGRVPEGISGIVGIAALTHDSVQAGFTMYMRLVALLSLSLAILNVLPLPALDGGRVLFVLIETIMRRPMNRKFELMTNAAGFAFLMLLIIAITVNDIWRLF